MKDVLKRVVKANLLCMSFLCGVSAVSQVSVLTQHNDNGRAGQNTNETVLNTSNVNQNGFGKLFWRTVDGFIYAQPLYVPGLTIQGATHNVVYVATQHNSVYAFDADNPNTPAPLWQVNLGTPVPSQDICIITGDTSPSDCPYYDISPEIGITSTPVIDPVAGIIYVVDRTKNTSNNTYHDYLHALNLTTGAEELAGPVEITGQVVGTGTGSSGGIVAFQAAYQNQRPALLLANGALYLMFGSVGDIGGVYHGWVMSYNASTLQQEGIFNVTPDGDDGGIWSAGQGPIADSSGNIYLMTGNGDFNANAQGGTDYGDSFIKFSGSSLTVSDYFTPDTQSTLNADNTDLGSGGPMLMPGTSLLVGMGKDTILRVVNSTNMGKYNSSTNNDVQEFSPTPNAFFSSPIYWNSPNFGPVIYIWGGGDYLKAFQYKGSTFGTTPVSQGTLLNSSGDPNAAALSISADGSMLGTGILWSTASISQWAKGTQVPGVVRAFDATNLTDELWDSTQNLARDDVGSSAKFAPPTIANGKVYVGSFSGQLQVYGLNPPAFQGVQFVQVASATPQSTTASVPVAYSGAQTAGDLNVVIVGWNDTTAAVQSVTDSAGNTYTLALGPTKGTGLSESIYYAKNILASNANTVTVTFNQGATKPDIRILEYSGVATSSPLDVSTGASGNTYIADSGYVNTNAANELIVGAGMVQSNTTVMAGAPFTPRVITSPDSDLAEDRIVNIPGSYHSWEPLNASGNWVMQVVTFKSAATSTVPFVSSVTPNAGPLSGGTAVTITGIDFAAGATVAFGSAAATNVTVVNGTTITATTPAGTAGAVTVTVTNSGGQSGSLTNGFTYIPIPTVNSVSPNTGSNSGGTSVTITGTNFAVGATVTFGTAAATNVTVVNSTTITATTPAGSAGAVTVTVTNPASQSGSLASGFTYALQPTYSDNFNRANGSLGSNWTTPSSTNPATFPLQIISDEVFAANTQVIHALEYYNAGTFANNQWASETVVNAPTTVTSTQAILLRSSNTNYYNDGIPLVIYAIGPANQTDFCAVGHVGTYANGDTHALYVAGSGPVFFWSLRNGVIDATCDDTTNNITGGNPGIGMAADQNATPTMAAANWQGGSLPSFSSSASDNFTRANAGWLGVNWWFTPIDPLGGPVNAFYTLTSNAAVLSSTGSSQYGAAIWTTALTGNKSIVTIGAYGGSGDFVGPVVRYSMPDGTSVNGTTAFYFAEANSTGQVEIFEYSGGNFNLLSNLGTYSGAVSTLELDASGTSPVTLTVKVNGSTFGSAYNDSTYKLTGTYDGFTIFGTSSTTVTGWSGN